MRKLRDIICDGCRVVLVADYFHFENLSAMGVDWSKILTFRVKNGNIVHYCGESCYIRCNSERKHHKRLVGGY